jgi:hypothetical protein
MCLGCEIQNANLSIGTDVPFSLHGVYFQQPVLIPFSSIFHVAAAEILIIDNHHASRLPSVPNTKTGSVVAYVMRIHMQG